MTAILVGMVLVMVVALVVISIASGEPDEDWSARRRRPDPEDGGLDDFLR